MTTARPLLQLVNPHVATRTVTDCLEVLQTLIAAPDFDPLFRGDVLRIPAGHPVYGWLCRVEDCERSHEGSWDLCHRVEWSGVRAGGGSFAEFLSVAVPFRARSWSDARVCRICPELPAVGQWGVCAVHAKRWTGHERWTRARGRIPDFEEWLSVQSPLPGLGECQVLACPELADHHPLRMCSRHRTLYDRQGRPGDARVPDLRGWSVKDGGAALVLTGRRCNEIIKLRLECVGRVNGLPLLWHDQTKIGNLVEGIRIPERLVTRIEGRQTKTIDRFVQRHGRPPNAEERMHLALFPRRSTNRAGLQGMGLWMVPDRVRELGQRTRHPRRPAPGPAHARDQSDSQRRAPQPCQAVPGPRLRCEWRSTTSTWPTPTLALRTP